MKILIKPKQNRPLAGRCKMWLAIIDKLRTESTEIILSLTEDLKTVYEEMLTTYEIKT